MLVPGSGAAVNCSTEAGTRVYSQPLRLQAESLIMVPLPLPRLLSTPPTLLQQPWLIVMPPGSAASIRPGGHVRGTKADCHHTQTKSMPGSLSALPS